MCWKGRRIIRRRFSTQTFLVRTRTYRHLYMHTHSLTIQHSLHIISDTTNIWAILYSHRFPDRISKISYESNGVIALLEAAVQSFLKGRERKKYPFSFFNSKVSCYMFAGCNARQNTLQYLGIKSVGKISKTNASQNESMQSEHCA